MCLLLLLVCSTARQFAGLIVGGLQLLVLALQLGLGLHQGSISCLCLCTPLRQLLLVLQGCARECSLLLVSLVSDSLNFFLCLFGLSSGRFQLLLESLLHLSRLAFTGISRLGKRFVLRRQVRYCRAERRLGLLYLGPSDLTLDLPLNLGVDFLLEARVLLL